jgi:diadenosine tetraphosphate (Ap4A) HIT family hydrolase
MSVPIPGATAEKAIAEKWRTGASQKGAAKATASYMMTTIPNDGEPVTAESVRQPGATRKGARKNVLGTLDFPLFYIEIHESEVPWLKVFIRRNVREFSVCTPEEKASVWNALDVIEKAMLAYYRPEKINIASFGNMLPQVHWHIMARFKEDSYFPEPMWGSKQRQSALALPPIEPLLETIAAKLLHS